MIKKSRNTFEGGIDQDTDEKLVRPNTNRGSQNFTISKDGNTVAFSTFNGFTDISGVTDLNNVDSNLTIYKLQLNGVITSGQRILEYVDGVLLVDLNATADINTLEDLITQLETGLSAFDITIYNNTSEIVIVSNDLTINTFDNLSYFYDVEFTTPPIGIGDTLYDITKNGVTTAYLSTAVVSNDSELQTEINTSMPNLDSTILSGGVLEIYPTANVTLSNFNANLTLVNSGVFANNTKITNETLSHNDTFTNLGFKEIAVTDTKRFVLLFRKNADGVFIIQVIYYDNSTNTLTGSGIIYMGTEPSTFINSENIIYTRDSNEKHVFYWNDGENPDKNIIINTSLLVSDYADFDTYIKALRESLYSQSSNNFDELGNSFIPRPIVYSIINNQDGGNLNPGERVLFTYKLKNGPNLSAIAPFSKGVLIPKNNISENPYGHVEDLGFIPTTTDNKFLLKFKIPGFTNILYNEIVPYVIHYNAEGSFKVRKLDDINLNRGSIIVDYNISWDVEEEVLLESLSSNISTENISKDQIVFKNRRIKANLKDTLLDTLINFDTRAYRFNSSREAKLYNIEGNLEVTIDGSLATPNWTAVPETADAINKFNDEYTNYSDWQSNQQYKYKADGATLGGEGANISYTFGELQVANQTLVNASQPWSGDPITGELVTVGPGGTDTLPSGQRYYNSHRNPVTLKGFQGGEVYRFFIYFWKEDKPTLAKWIGDIKFPENVTIARGNAGVPGDPVTLYQQNISFSVDTTSFLGEATAFSIGYVPRDNSDSSVIFTAPDLGMHFSTTLTTNNSVLFHTGFPEHTTKLTNDGSLSADDTTDFNECSKIKCFPFDLQVAGLIDSYGSLENLYLKEIGLCSSTLPTQIVVVDKHQRDFRFIYETNTDGLATPNELIGVSDILRLEDNIDITDYLTLIDSTTRVLNSTYMDGLAVPQVHPEIGGNDYIGDRYKKTIVITDSDFNLTADTVTLFSLRRAVPEQYGGARYTDRQTNSIVLGSYTEVTGGVQSSVPEGDTFACLPDLILDHSRVEDPTLVTQSDRGTVFPIESKTNFHSLYAEDPTSVYDMQTYYDLYKSINGIDVDGVFDPTDNIDIPYNINTSSLSIQSNTTADYPFTISISEKKIQGERYDSWLIFGTNNSKIIDPVWGQINKLIDEKDRLFVFQENAVSQQYVEQIQQQIDDISEITLGTGDVAGQHIYILTNIGIQSNNQATQVKNDIIFQDITRNKIYSINQGELSGISNLLIEDDVSDLNRTIIYDRQTDIIFIPNYNEYPTNSFYITYDNNIKKLITDKSFNVNDDTNNLYFSGLTNMVSIVSGNFELFNKNKNPVFTTSTTPTSVSFIANQESERVKTFDNLFINLEANSYAGLTRTDEILTKPSKIIVETQYQTTGEVTTTDSNIRRLGRYWRYTIPRDTEGNRIRDYWAKVTLIFDNNDKELIIKEVITSYRVSNLTRL